MRVTIEIMTIDGGLGGSYTVPDAKEAIRQVNHLVSARDAGIVRTIIDGGRGKCLDIPLAEVSSIVIKF